MGEAATETAVDTSPAAMQALWERAEKAADAAEGAVEQEQNKRLDALKKPAGSAPAPAKGDKPAKAEGETDDETEAPKAKKAEKQAKPGKGGKPEKLLVPSPAALAELEAQAKRLGYVIDGGTVAVADRVAFREERRQARNELQEAQAAFDAKVGKARAELEQEFGPLIAVRKAWAARDYNAVAKLLDPEAKDWRDLNQREAKRAQSPEAQRVAELERREQEREERDAKARQDAEEAAARAEHDATLAKYREELSASMLESEDKIVKALAKQNGFIHAVFEVQSEYYDGKKTIPPEEAIRVKRNDGTTILETLRSTWESLSAAFGDRAADPTHEASLGAPGRTGASPRAGKKNKNLSRNGAAEAAPKGTYASEKEFIDRWAHALENSTDSDDEDDD